MSPEDIRTNISTKPAWAERAILAIHRYQTSTEQRYHETTELNGVGFNGVDAYILSSLADQLMRGRHLTEKQLAIAYRKLPKYAKQLHTISQAKG